MVEMAVQEEAVVADRPSLGGGRAENEVGKKKKITKMEKVSWFVS